MTFMTRRYCFILGMPWVCRVDAERHAIRTAATSNAGRAGGASISSATVLFSFSFFGRRFVFGEFLTLFLFHLFFLSLGGQDGQ